mmetsp:Transcript_17002/g.57703  ORF Transcript_17002/g.57703 Transcript_17002/m.57703 type:complete len:212 (-) Transcript_17002:244-879(-)
MPASMACPNVCPRLRSARPPPLLRSRSSRATTAALHSHERATAARRSAASPAARPSMCSSCHARKSTSPMSPYLTTSERPDRSSRGGSVESAAMSATTASGWWKAPIMFLPRGWFTPVLPPTDESTMAMSVVGTCTKDTPRWYTAAAKPHMSPTTPPPSATKDDERSRRCSMAASMMSPSVAMSLNLSPSGSVTVCTSLPARRRDSTTVSA